MDALQIIIPAFTGILGLFIGYFLKKSEYERQRRDEREDRKILRRVQYRDKKLLEVQAYIDTYTESIQHLGLLELLTIQEADEEEIDKINSKLNESMGSAMKWVNAFAALEDSELSAAHDELAERFNVEWKNALELDDAIKDDEFDSETTLKRMLEFQARSLLLLSVMQTRIHVLVETME